MNQQYNVCGQHHERERLITEDGPDQVINEGQHDD
jgi:hypothetical protein